MNIQEYALPKDSQLRVTADNHESLYNFPKNVSIRAGTSIKVIKSNI